MIIAVASGKGGTGKTTVSLHLALAFNQPVQLLDCDVEEPNIHLFLSGEAKDQEIVSLLTPKIDAEKCDNCGDCRDFCQFNAIAVAGKKTLIFPELCHACGGCALVCPNQAINEIESRIGIIKTYQHEHIQHTKGCLDVGVPSATPLIHAVKAKINKDIPAIIDAPPGTTCTAIAAMDGVDFILFVTEPTPFGLHDLKLAVATARQMQRPFAVVINRSDIGDRRVHHYCEEENIPLLLEIPNDIGIAQAYSRGETIFKTIPKYRERFMQLSKQLLTQNKSSE